MTVASDFTASADDDPEAWGAPAAPGPSYPRLGPWLPLVSILVDIAAGQRAGTAPTMTATGDARTPEPSGGDPSLRATTPKHRRDTR